MSRIVFSYFCLIFSCLTLCANNLEQGRHYYKYKDYSSALPFLQTAAKEGYGEACYLLGNIYQFGLDIPENYEIAIRMYKRGLEYGYQKGEAELGLMYETGKGVEKDLSKAVSYYRKSAAKGISNGYYFLGLATIADLDSSLPDDSVFFYFNNIISKDSDDPLMFPHWYGWVNYYLAQCYEFGIGVRPNIKEAIKYYAKSYESGTKKPFHLYRASQLAILNDNMFINGMSATDRLVLAITKGYDDPKAYYQLSSRILQYNNNKSDAFTYLEEAAKAGYGPAQRTIAQWYKDGINIPANKLKSEEYNKLADTWYAEHGDEYAEEQRIENDQEYRNSKGIYRFLDTWKDKDSTLYLVISVNSYGEPIDLLIPKVLYTSTYYKYGELLSPQEISQVQMHIDTINSTLKNNGLPELEDRACLTNYTTGSVVWLESPVSRTGRYIEQSSLRNKPVYVLLKKYIKDLKTNEY